MPEDTKRHGSHDEFVAKCFGDLELARAFCRHYLPAPICHQIDLERLELAQSSFVDDELRRSYSDLVYTVPLKECPPDEDHCRAYVYVLVEHKSESDEFTVFQLLRYMVRIWESELSGETRRAGFRLPPIVPLVLHHGRTRFRAPTDFSELVVAIPGMDDLVPRFRCVLVDLMAIQAEDLPTADDRLHAVLAVMRSVFGEEIGGVAADVFARLAAIMDRAESRATVLFIMNYILQSASKLTDEDFLSAIKPLERTGGDTMSTLIDRWKAEGRLEGREEGRLEGREEGRLEGRVEDRRDSIVVILTARFDSIPESVDATLQQISDLQRLEKLTALAATCDSVSRFLHEAE
jgi:predicted transposase YdaD